MWIRDLEIDKELESLSGWLYPDNAHIDLPCPLDHADDVELMSGTNAYLTDRFPNTAIAINCDNVLVIDETPAEG